MRDAGGPIAQPTSDTARDVACEIGPLPGQPIEGRRGHLEQQAVAHGTDARGSRPAGEHADFADGLAGVDLGHEPVAGFLAIGLCQPDLHATSRQQEQAIGIVTLAEQPIATAAHAWLELVKHQRGFIPGN
ncbi:MAG: hypothetical protein IPJ97_15845 [Proteobacteria bacterium]|nr:hypothetical protein [Pseudomonadota bacterium]